MPTVEAFDRITVEPEKCGGKPCIRGMRITVRRVLELLATYTDRDALFADYPFLEPEDLQQAYGTPQRIGRSSHNEFASAWGGQSCPRAGFLPGP